MNIPCPQCGGDVRLQDTSGFVDCPYCRNSLVLDLSGVRLHLLYQPRHDQAAVLPLLRRWCDASGFPSPMLVASPRLVYYPFWRFVGPGHPHLVPAWPTLETRFANFTAPAAEQVVYDPTLVGGARIVEASMAESAARSVRPEAPDSPPGDLVHIPFYEVEARIGPERVRLCVDACAGQLFSDRRLAGTTGTEVPTGAAPVRGTAIVGWLAMFLAAAAVPNAWVAAGAVTFIGCVTYWLLAAQLGREHQ